MAAARWVAGSASTTGRAPRSARSSTGPSRWQRRVHDAPRATADFPVWGPSLVQFYNDGDVPRFGVGVTRGTRAARQGMLGGDLCRPSVPRSKACSPPRSRRSTRRAGSDLPEQPDGRGLLDLRHSPVIDSTGAVPRPRRGDRDHERVVALRRLQGRAARRPIVRPSTATSSRGMR